MTTRTLKISQLEATMIKLDEQITADRAGRMLYPESSVMGQAALRMVIASEDAYHVALTEYRAIKGPHASRPHLRS